MPSLMREDAVARERLLSITSYDVELDLTRGAEIFGSTVTIRFAAAVPGSDTFIELAPHQLHRITLNGVDLPVAALSQGRYPLSNLELENVLTVSADMAYSNSGEGLHRFVDPEDGLTYTYMMGFLDMASRVFACFEQPDLKAPYRLRVSAPPEWTVVANEAGVQVEPGRWEFTQTKPLSTYFVTLVAGPYHSIYREHDGVRFGIHARQSYRQALETDATEIFDVTFGCWDRFHQLYGVRYAFGETYDQCFVPEFNAGAMENPGCVTFRDEAFMYRSTVTQTQRERRATVIAHEMAHMWFGDLVSMTWWDDLWLNESFANWMGIRGATEGTRFTGAQATGTVQNQAGYNADQRPSTHPVSGHVAESGDALNNFDGISYAKGGAVLNQLAAWLGDEVFFAGLRLYFDRFRYSNATLTDLMSCLSEASGRGLADWSRQWLQTTGPNVLRLDSVIRHGRYTDATVVQSAVLHPPILRPHRIRIGLYRIVDGVAMRTEQITMDIEGERTEVPQLIGVESADLLLVNDDDVTYAKSRLDAGSLSALPKVLSTLVDPVARAMMWSILIDMVRDAELAPLEYLDILAEAITGETRVAQVETQLSFARRYVVDRCLDRGERSAGLIRLEAIASGLLDTAEPGGGIQLAALHCRIACASTPAGVVFARNLLDGSQVPAGVTVDSELRWAIITRLAVLGEVDEPQISAELDSDPSSQGLNHAATCRAALPDPAGKAAAWETVMTDRRLSNHVLRATAIGFWWPEQAELLAEYVPRYFAEVVEGIGQRMPWQMKHLGTAMFPHEAMTEPAVELAEQLLARDDVPAELRRSIVDDVDDARRALRVRAAWPAHR